MIVMSCNDMNKFHKFCVAFASRIQTFSICDAIASGKKWFSSLASQYFKKISFPGGTPGEGEVAMAYPAAFSWLNVLFL
jgi:hypothetical protein